jgi:hypothetical protein
MWYFQYKNQQNGPIDSEVIKALLAKQTLNRDSFVWKEGMQNWCRLADTELKSLLLPVLPPPISPAGVQNTAIQPPPIDQTSIDQKPIITPVMPVLKEETDAILPEYFKTARGIKSLWIWCIISYGLGLCLVLYGAMVSSNQGDYGYNGSYGGALLFGLLTICCGGVLWLLIFYRSWAVIEDGSQPIPAGKAVGFMFIPFYNYYWQFVAIAGLAKRLNRYCAEKAIPADPVNEQLALAGCILFCTLWVPFLNILTGIAYAIISFLVWQSIILAVCSIVRAKEEVTPVAPPAEKPEILASSHESTPDLLFTRGEKKEVLMAQELPSDQPQGVRPCSHISKMRIFLSFVILVIVLAVAWIHVESQTQRKLEASRRAIVSQCERAVPMLNRRYEHLGGLLKLCELKNIFLVAIPDRPIHEDDNGQIGPVRFPGDYLVFPDTDYPWALEMALDHFANADTPFQKAMGALAIEYSVGSFIDEASGQDIIKSSDLIKLVKRDLAATDREAQEFEDTLYQNVDNYNLAVEKGFFADRSRNNPIGRDSVVE